MKPRNALLPFSLTAAIIVVDQVTKALVESRVRMGDIAFSAFGDFFWLVRQHNLGMAFSLLDDLPPVVRSIALIVLPLALIGVLLYYYFKHEDLAGLQRWLVCGIAGGGLGNLIDRVFRPQGVVDFLSFKFYGILGYERWPTFNVADSAVVVSAILLAATTIAADLRKAK